MVNLRLNDAESADAAEVTVSGSMIKRYRAALDRLCTSLKSDCRARGMHYALVPSDTRVDEFVMGALRRVLRQDPCSGFLVQLAPARMQQDDLLRRTAPGYCWVFDPIDGTTNFAHGLPIFCASLGLELDGETIVAAVYDPTRRELFTAERGQGARLNGERLPSTEALKRVGLAPVVLQCK